MDGEEDRILRAAPADAGPPQIPRPEPRLQHRARPARSGLPAPRSVRQGDGRDNGVVQAESLAHPTPRMAVGSNPTEVLMELQGKRAAVLVEQVYQELEVWYPVYRLREAGCKVTLVGPEAGQNYPSKLGYPAKSDKAARDVSADDFDLLVIPGGYAPDHMRRSEAMVRLVSTMAEQGKVIASIC